MEPAPERILGFGKTSWRGQKDTDWFFGIPCTGKIKFGIGFHYVVFHQAILKKLKLFPLYLSQHFFCFVNIQTSSCAKIEVENKQFYLSMVLIIFITCLFN